MSRLQIRGSEDDRVRAELRERIGELVRSLYEFAGSGGFTPEEVGEVQKRAVEEVRTLYYALTGYQPTGEEIGAMIDPIG